MAVCMEFPFVSWIKGLAFTDDAHSVHGTVSQPCNGPARTRLEVALRVAAG